MPLALGGIAASTLWLGGQATLGNPLFVLLIAWVGGRPAGAEAIVGVFASLAGTGVGVGLAAWFFGGIQDRLRLVLYTPRVGVRELYGDSRHP